MALISSGVRGGGFIGHPRCAGRFEPCAALLQVEVRHVRPPRRAPRSPNRAEPCPHALLPHSGTPPKRGLRRALPWGLAQPCVPRLAANYRRLRGGLDDSAAPTEAADVGHLARAKVGR